MARPVARAPRTYIAVSVAGRSTRSLDVMPEEREMITNGYQVQVA
jgi:hypothetical protein